MTAKPSSPCCVAGVTPVFRRGSGVFESVAQSQIMKILRTDISQASRDVRSAAADWWEATQPGALGLAVELHQLDFAAADEFAGEHQLDSGSKFNWN